MNDAQAAHSILRFRRTTPQLRPAAVDAMVRSFIAEVSMAQAVFKALDDCPDLVDNSKVFDSDAGTKDQIYWTYRAMQSAFTDRLLASGVLNDVFRSVMEEFTVLVREEHITHTELRACASRVITLSDDPEEFYAVMAHVAGCAECQAAAAEVAAQIQSGGGA